jgi:hypothetical protein
MSPDEQKRYSTAIRKVAEEEGWQIYEGYSGRNMYGKKCLGVVVSSPEVVVEMADDCLWPDPAIDQLGLQYIVYWPQLKWEAPADATD